MGNVIDLESYRQKLRHNHTGTSPPFDGICMETVPPFITFRLYQAGIVSRELHLLSEYLVREIMDNMI